MLIINKKSIEIYFLQNESLIFLLCRRRLACPDSIHAFIILHHRTFSSRLHLIKKMSLVQPSILNRIAAEGVHVCLINKFSKNNFFFPSSLLYGHPS